MLKKYLKINETALAVIILLIIAVPLFTSYQNKKTANEAIQKQLTKEAEDNAFVEKLKQAEQLRMYTEAPWRKEYENAVNSYIDSTSGADGILVAGLFKKLRPYKTQTKLVFDTASSTDNVLKILIEARGYTFTFENVSTGDGWYELDSKITAEENGKIVFQKEMDFGMSGVILAESTDATYLLVSTYSGGMHCCTEILPIVVNQKGIFEGASLNTGNMGFANDTDFFLKDKGLYFVTRDDRFEYFYTDFADSQEMFLPVPYYVDKQTGGLVKATSEFYTDYQKMISVLDTAMSKIRKYDQKKLNDVFEYAVSREFTHLNPTLRLFAVIETTKDDIAGNEKWGEPLRKYRDDLSFLLNNNDKQATEMVYDFGDRLADQTYTQRNKQFLEEAKRNGYNIDSNVPPTLNDFQTLRSME